MIEDRQRDGGAQLLRRRSRSPTPRTAASARSRTAPRCTAASASATTTATRSPAGPQPIMYYYDGSAIAQVLDAARARSRRRPIHFAVIGLGTGSLACRAEPDDNRALLRDRPRHDPASRAIRTASASSPECRPDLPIMLGDARLTLADAPDGSYDVIIVDAFTSDAIPIHLHHARGDGDLQGQAHAQRHRGRAHLQPPSRARLGGRRHRRRQRHGDAHQRRAPTSSRTTPITSSPARSWRWRAADDDFGPIGQVGILGRCSRARPASNGCGPTTIPTSSAR